MFIFFLLLEYEASFMVGRAGIMARITICLLLAIY